MKKSCDDNSKLKYLYFALGVIILGGGGVRSDSNF